MVNKELLKEIKFILKCSAFIDVAGIIIASFYINVSDAVFGFLLGTILLAADLFFIALSVQDAARGALAGSKNGSKKAVFYYILRFLFLGVFLVLALKIKSISFPCTIIPLFYPKLIYPVKAVIFSKKEG